jgi:hypothetical protein
LTAGKGRSESVPDPVVAGEVLNIRFRPEPDQPMLVAAAAEYDQLWRSEGVRILAALHRITGLRLVDQQLEATVHEANSASHPLRLRASYDAETKRGTLIHELAHRLLDHRRD